MHMYIYDNLCWDIYRMPEKKGKYIWDHNSHVSAIVTWQIPTYSLVINLGNRKCRLCWWLSCWISGCSTRNCLDEVPTLKYIECEYMYIYIYIYIYIYMYVYIYILWWNVCIYLVEHGWLKSCFSHWEHGMDFTRLLIPWDSLAQRPQGDGDGQTSRSSYYRGLIWTN